MAEQKIKVIYFDAKGKAEITRLALHVGGIPFEDVRLTREEFKQKKEEGYFKFGQAPLLEVDGKFIAQSDAMARWAGRKSNLYPADENIAVKIDEVAGLLEDFLSKFRPSFFEQDNEKKLAMRKVIVEEHIPTYFGKYFENLLIANGSTGYFVGNSLTLADLYVIDKINAFTSGMDGIPSTVFDGYKNIQEVKANVNSHPKIKEWNETHVQKPQEPKVKIVYFDAKGKAEVTRLCLTIAGTPFEDVRLTREQFAQKKQEGYFKFGQGPVIEIEGKQVAQSGAMARWAAKKSNLYPKDDFLAIRVDEAIGLIEDFFGKCVPMFRAQDQEQKLAVKKQIIEEFIPTYCGQYFENLINANGETGYCVGNSLTLADLELNNLTEMLTNDFFGIPADVFDKYQNISKVRANVVDHPKVKEWKETKHE